MKPGPGAGSLLLCLCAAAASAGDHRFHGLLRARDLTPFGYLRLDMRPALAGYVEPGQWAFEMDVGYQNTWALSPGVERYLNALPGRRELGPAELHAIRDLPGENYLVDLELTQLDVAAHYKLTPQLAGYVVLSAVTYGGGFLDATIEGFHDTFGFSRFGRPAASRNDVNIVTDLKSSSYATFEAPTRGGLLDPTVGLRYATAAPPDPWKFVLELAAKIPVSGRRFMLSTGRADVGVQASMQHFSTDAAAYASLSAVYFAGATELLPLDSQIVPTLVLGYERALGATTNVILQGYVSPSVFGPRQTDLDELLGTKYQLSLGLRHRRGPHLFTVAVTENLQNINNTPDVGVQLGWLYVPGWGASGWWGSGPTARD